jgi:hypothetical protein
MIKCKKCGFRRLSDVSDPFKYQFKCFVCSHSGILRSKGAYNYEVIQVPEHIDSSELLKRLKEVSYGFENK